MSTPTLAQAQKLLSLVPKSATNDQMQNLVGNGDLFQMLLAGTDLSRVDRSAFRALLAPPPKVINWTPVGEYLAKLHHWNERFNLGLPEAQIDELVLPEHDGPHRPTSISLTSGKGLQRDREVVQQIIAYEMARHGHKYTDYIAKNHWSVAYYPGCEPSMSLEPQLAPALLDIGRFWDPKNGVTIPGVRQKLLTAGEPMPTLQVDWLMAFNPQVLAAIDYETVPGFIATGLVVDSDGAPGFGRGGDEACAYGYWDDGAWRVYSVVSFREC